LEDDLTTSMPNYADGTRDITQDDVDELNRKLWKYEINTPNRIAHFLAQCAVESQRGFGRVEQYNPSDPITYFTGEYENNDNAKILGNTEKGDERIITDGALYVGQSKLQEREDAYAYFSEVIQ